MTTIDPGAAMKVHDGNNLGGESVLGGNAQPEGDFSFDDWAAIRSR